VAELDYAFLAEYAKVEPGGNLTAVGASYTHLFVPAFPNQHLVSVAGRVRAAVGESPSLRITFQTPNETFQMQADVQLNAVPDARPYGPALDMVGLQFAMSFVVPLPTQGLYEVHLALDEVHVRMLAFTAAQQADKA
jgi:hypothetical protein